MKKLSLIATCFVMTSVMTFAQSSSEKTLAEVHSTGKASIAWNSNTIDVGKIEKGKPTTATFEFKNTGNVPVMIFSAKGQCGCTAIEYSKQAIAPNEKGFVKATYNAASTGVFNKSITVTANTNESQIQLQLKGEVF
jgi:hypothetical protein